LDVRPGPADRLPVRRENESRTGIGHLDAVAARLIHIQKEGLLDRVLVRTGFDMHAVLEEDVGRAQDLLALVERIGDVVEAAGAIVIAGIGRNRSSCSTSSSHRGFRAVVEHDLLGGAQAQIVFENIRLALMSTARQLSDQACAHCARARETAAPGSSAPA
jgi:hypothetical protein